MAPKRNAAFRRMSVLPYPGCYKGLGCVRATSRESDPGGMGKEAGFSRCVRCAFPHVPTFAEVMLLQALDVRRAFEWLIADPPTSPIVWLLCLQLMPPAFDG